MIAAVADTHAALWHLFDDPRLSSAAANFITEAATQRLKVALSAISLAEVVYLIEKGRLPASAYEDLTTALADPEHVLTEAAFTAAVVRAMRQIPRARLGETRFRGWLTQSAAQIPNQGVRRVGGSS